MNKQLLVSTFIAGALILGGAGCQENQTDQSSTLTTPTPEVLVTSTPEVSTTTTTSLIDRPVNEWPRYEFKELGFSMQLPFVSSSLNFGFFEVCFSQERPCPPSSTMYSYTGILHKNKNDVGMFLGTYSSNFYVERDGRITDIEDFFTTPEPKVKFFYGSPIKIHPVYKKILNGVVIMVFDADKDLYNSAYEPNDPMRAQGEQWGTVFRLPGSKKFKAVMFDFYQKDFPLEKIKQGISTIIFN
jgi:hypothetical protein